MAQIKTAWRSFQDFFNQWAGSPSYDVGHGKGCQCMACTAQRQDDLAW